VLCVCVVRKKVWLGLEAGVLIIYDANSRKPYLQVRQRNWCVLVAPRRGVE